MSFHLATGTDDRENSTDNLQPEQPTRMNGGASLYVLYTYAVVNERKRSKSKTRYVTSPPPPPDFANEWHNLRHKA